MATRFRNPRLKSESYKRHHPANWKSYVERAAAEVYAYSPEEWSNLYRRVFGSSLAANEIETERKKRQNGNEDDFGTGKGKYGAGGEGEYHKALRLWVIANAQIVRSSFTGARSETEFCLDSGDRVDAVYHLIDRTIVVEESRASRTW
jgi:hypothetical protein